MLDVLESFTIKKISAEMVLEVLVEFCFLCSLLHSSIINQQQTTTKKFENKKNNNKQQQRNKETKLNKENIKRKH